jgi:hypothetical protein
VTEIPIDESPIDRTHDVTADATGLRRRTRDWSRWARVGVAVAVGALFAAAGLSMVVGVAGAVDATPQPAAFGSASPSPAASATPEVWVATPSAPVRLWVGGDSLAGQLRWGLEPLLDEAGVVDPFFFHKTSSGICRYDFYDWGRKIELVMTRVGPDALVMMVGANDAQNAWSDGTWVPYGTAEWKAVYRERVGHLMDTMLLGGARRVYWVGAPIMKQRWRSARMQTVNAIFLQQVRSRPGVKYVGIWRLFSDDEGRYVARWRRSDGVHFSPAGWRRLARYVYGRIRRDWLPAAAPTSSATPSPSPSSSGSGAPSPSS